MLPFDFLLAACFAVVIHELFHLATIFLCHGEVMSIRMKPFGIEIEMAGIYGFREAVCAIAGPLGSFLLLLLIRKAPLVGICGFVQGVFNLLPLYPLDGGRFLYATVEYLWPGKGDRVVLLMKYVVLLLSAVYVFFRICFYPRYIL